MSEHEEFLQPISNNTSETLIDNEAASTNNSTKLSIEIPTQVEEPDTQVEEPVTQVEEPDTMETIELLNNSTPNDMITLTKIITLILIKGDKYETYQQTISPEVQSILTKLMEHTECLDDVEKSLKPIIRDNKIDANDVPQIMMLLTSMYNSISQFKISSVTTKNCGDVLKFLVNIVIKEGLISINGDTNNLITCLFNIIDSSIQLMQMKDTMSEVRGLFKCIKNMFSK